MNSSPEPPTNSETPLSPEEQEFEATLQQVEASLNVLKERYAQIQRDQQRQAELKNRLEEIQPNRRRERTKLLQEELKQIATELETLELNLESRLFSFSSLKEPFWQAIRFGGLGVLLGWLLKSCAS